MTEEHSKTTHHNSPNRSAAKRVHRSLARRTPHVRPRAETDSRAPSTDNGTLPNLKWSFADCHNRLQPGGWARQTTGRELQIAQALNCVNMRLKAGAVRELHWHKPDEWGFVIKGRVRITAIDQDGHAFQDDVGEGDIWNFPGGIPHSIQGLEGDGSEFLLVFNDGNFNEDETFLVTDFLAHIPKEVLAKNFGVPESAFANIPKEELYIFQSQVPGPLAADRVVGAGPVPLTLQPPADGPRADRARRAAPSALSTPPISRRPR